jgi:hypothetical protein
MKPGKNECLALVHVFYPEQCCPAPDWETATSMPRNGAVQLSEITEVLLKDYLELDNACW